MAASPRRRASQTRNTAARYAAMHDREDAAE